jgi:hypothetical protein
MDCADPAALARFWASALGYVLEDPPDGYVSWPEYWRAIGVPEDELVGVDGSESVVDPDGVGPRIWFQRVPEPKIVKNRLHLDLKVGGGREVPADLRRERVDAEVDRLVRAGATTLRVHEQPGLDHYAVTLTDPEGNEFCVG